VVVHPRPAPAESPPERNALRRPREIELDGTAPAIVTLHLYGSSRRAAAPAAGAGAILGDVVRRQPASILLASAAAAALALPLAGCGGDASTADASATGASASAPRAVERLVHHPRPVDPSAGVPVDRGGGSRASAAGDGGFRAPVTASGHLRATSQSLPRPRSDAEIRRTLAASGIPAGDAAALTGDGLAVAPLGAPPVVQAVIQAGNQIARLPYRYGGGHATWVDTAYDCSASISFAFAAAGLIATPMASGELVRWGDAGPGRWITVYANGGHAFMTVAGLRFDTSGLIATDSRWQRAARGTAGFAVRHPPGL
jgi:cell wall-associated NlpC family hydrolase